MYSTWSNIKFYVGVVLWLLIIFAVFLVGWGMSFTNVNLATSPKTIGIISFTGAKATSAGRAGMANSFVIRLVNDPNGYWIYRASGNYSDLYQSLTPETDVTIFHSANIGSNGLYTVYQLQHGNHIDYSKDEYEGKEKWAGRLIALPGAMLLLIMMVFKVRKRLRIGRQPKTAISK